MKISLKLTQNVYFTIQKAFDNLFTEDDVRLNIIIKNHNYFIQQDSFRYEIGYNLKYHICNIKETNFLDIGKEYYKYQCQMLKDIENFDLNRFSDYLVFSNNHIAVLIYRQEKKVLCQVTYNNWEKDIYESLFLGELTNKTIQDWLKELDLYFIEKK